MKKSLQVTIILLLIIGLLFGCKPEDPENRFKDTRLVIQGSDTLLEVSMYWVENFLNANPGINISVTGGGSGTGIAALLNGTVDLATASRSIKDSEVEAAREQGIEITEFVVAWDGISIVINNDNPVNELTIEQASKIYTGEIINWSEVGGDDLEIVVISRDSSSGTFEYFKSRVVQMNKTVKENDYTQNALFLTSNVSVREEVSANVGAVGYIGLGYLNESVKAVRIIGEESEEAVTPSIENIQNGSYPISRGLFIYASDEGLSDLGTAFLDYITGAEGQAIALEIGFVPIN